MAKVVVAQNGVVINIVNASASDPSPVYYWTVPDSQVVSVGDVFDPHDAQVDQCDQVAFQVLFRHENLIRELIRTVRSNSTLNTQATTNGLPTSANSADVTAAQFRTAVKSLLP